MSETAVENTFSIEIDGQSHPARPGQMIIEVMDTAGVSVPRFCYHKHLSIAANCRMCLVEVEQGGRPIPKPLPACATPVANGMKVQTRSALAQGGQKGVMEFLLINHPLDCPICDQGGECELQDLAMGYGRDISRYTEGKRVVEDKDIGPLISTDMTRCIHCTRCVRFGEEIAGLRELGATGRGQDMSIGTYIERSVDSELSGNIIDLCPVGALTSKPFRYTARAWELRSIPGIAPHDAVGSNIALHVRRNQVMRVVPTENDAINECWLSDRDRFSYQGLRSKDRLAQPRIKVDGQWQDADWNVALAFVIEGLQKTIQTHGPQQFGALISPTATLEEMFLANRLVRGLGSHNIDHRLRQGDFRGHPHTPSLGLPIAAVETLDAALIVGAYLRKDLPMVAHRLRKMGLAGGQIHLIDNMEYDYNFPLSSQLVVSPSVLVNSLAAIANIVLAKIDPALKTLVENAKIEDSHRKIAESLQQAEHAVIWLGDLALAHPDYSLLEALASAIASACGAKQGTLPTAANTVGAHLAGVLPHQEAGGSPIADPGLDAHSMLAQGLQGYFLLGVEPELDSWNPAAAQRSLAQAEFVVALSAYDTASQEAYADAILPIAAFSETAGTFVNAEGTWQDFPAAVQPFGEARPAWKVIRVLANGLALDGFTQNDTGQIRAQLQQALDLAKQTTHSDTPPTLDATLALQDATLVRLGVVPPYASDALVRRATALQQTVDAELATVSICPTLAQQLRLLGEKEVRVQQGEEEATLPLLLDERVPADSVRVPAGVLGSEHLGPMIGPIALKKVGG